MIKIFEKYSKLREFLYFFLTRFANQFIFVSINNKNKLDFIFVKK